MSTFGDQIFQYGGVPIGGPFTTGPVQFVKPGTGSDGHDGKSPDRAVATLSQAQTNMDADKNGIIYLIAESNSAGSTTYRISGSTFTFSKSGVKIVGVNQQGLIGHRSRIGNTAGAADVSPLMDWTANNGAMYNVHLFYGEADAGDLGAFRVTGERNYFNRCHFAGIGDDTQDAANAYSINVTGNENMFEQCVFGVDTIKRGTAANDALLLSGGAARNIFKDCLFLMWPENAQARFVTSSVTGGRWTLFDGCIFIANPDIGSYVAPTEVFNVTGSANTCILKNCTSVGVTDWENPVSGMVMVDGAPPTGNTSGLSIDVVA